MASPVTVVSIVQAIINLALKIKKEVETFRYNREDCRKIGELVATVRDVAEGLRKTTEKEDGGALVGGALKALKQALERAWDVIVACQRKNAVLRVLDADAIAVKLRRVYLDVSLNLSAVVLANGTYNTSKLADINGIVADLRADVADNTRMLAKILEIVAALPDLQKQVARLVQSFSDSTDDDASYYQNESTRETKKTNDVARYSTYSSSYAYPGAQLQYYTTVPCDQRRYGASASVIGEASHLSGYSCSAQNNTIHPSSVLGSKTIIGSHFILAEGSELGDMCSVERSKIGRHCRIGSNVKIGPDCILAEGSKLGDKCSVERCKIGCHCRIGSNVKIGPDCILAEGSELGDKCSVEGSKIGRHCRIGFNVKIVNSAVENYVVIEDGCHIQGSLVCNNVQLQERAVLEDCRVEDGYIVTASSEHKEEFLARKYSWF